MAVSNNSNAGLPRYAMPEEPVSTGRRLARQAIGALDRALELIPPPNFHWAATWYVTEVCNLRCRYCFIHFKKEHPPMEAQLDALRRLRPKYVMTVGGEPLLVPWLPQALRVLRDEWNPWIALTTNGLVAASRLEEVVPLVNSFVVSCDGLGSYNQENRGVDSKKVLQALEKAARLVEAHGLETQLGVNVVVTRSSYRGVRALYEAVRQIAPRTGICFNPVTPYDDPLSVASDPAVYAEYLALVAPLAADPAVDFCGPERKALNSSEAPAAANGAVLPSKTAGGQFRVRCLRQFVWANVEPNGHVQYCNPSIFAMSFRQDIVRQARARHYASAMQSALLMVNKLTWNRRSADCYHPCNCLPFLDDLIHAEEGAALPRWADWFRGRFTPEEVDQAEAFLRAYTGHGLQQAIKEVFLGRSSS